MLLDPAHAGLELADEDAVADDRSMVFVTARRSPTICSPSSLRVDRKSKATSARIRRRSSTMRLAGSSVMGASLTVSSTTATAVSGSTGPGS